MEKIRYLNFDCIKLKNETLEIIITQSIGIRIIYLGFCGGENIFAELPNLTIDCPGIGSVNLYGGHRLWHSPQVPERTHLPDNYPVIIKEFESGVEVIRDTEIKTGIQKSIRITLPDNNANVIVDHIIKNEGVWPIETAPWAITSLKPGGVAILPQMTEFIDVDGVWPNRCLAFWPFTDINSPYIHWGNRFLFVEAKMEKGRLKFGFPNPKSWLAYYNRGLLFIKKASYSEKELYFDMGSSSQLYCQPEFIELETLGPRKVIAPGEIVSHREIWNLYSNIDFTIEEDSIQDIVKKLNIEPT
jgi:hypothetical protein